MFVQVLMEQIVRPLEITEINVFVSCHHPSDEREIFGSPLFITGCVCLVLSILHVYLFELRYYSSCSKIWKSNRSFFTASTPALALTSTGDSDLITAA